MNVNIKQLVIEYLESLNKDTLLLESFNEKSLQHNIGEYLKERLGDNYIVQYERNINYFKSLKNISKHLKSEIDLVVLEKNSPKNIHEQKKPIFIIELKFIKAFDQSLQKKTASPTKTLYECLCDIEFVEQCKDVGIEAMSLILCDYDIVHSNVSFDKGRKPKYESLWKSFREGLTLTSHQIELINKEGNKNISITSKSRPSLSWTDLFEYEDEEGHSGLKLKYIIN